MPASTRILSTGRQQFTREAYLAHVEQHSRSFIASANFVERTWNEFMQLLDYVRLDVHPASDFSPLGGSAPY